MSGVINNKTRTFVIGIAFNIPPESSLPARRRNVRIIFRARTFERRDNCRFDTRENKSAVVRAKSNRERFAVCVCDGFVFNGGRRFGFIISSWPGNTFARLGSVFFFK